jgi:hypothetical protein
MSAFEKIPMPSGTVPSCNLGGAFTVSNGKKLFGRRFAVVGLDGKMMTDWAFKTDAGIKCFGGQTLLLPEGKGWALYDMWMQRVNGGVYADVQDLGDSCIATSRIDRKRKYALADLRGMVKADLECEIIRPFWNGYAVFTRQGQAGVVDVSGRVVVQPRFVWLSNMEYGYFRFSSEATPTLNTKMGLVDTNDQILFDEAHGFSDIRWIDENNFFHGVHYRFSVRDDTQTLTSSGRELIYDMPATGYYLNGRVIEAKYLWIGLESEGLRAFAAYTQSALPPPQTYKGRFTAGYMDTDWNHEIVVADFGISSGFEFSELMQEVKDFGARLRPFQGGYATFAIQESRGNAFLGHNFIGPVRTIDRNGNIVSTAPIPKGQIIHERILNGPQSDTKTLESRLLKKGFMLSGDEPSCGLVNVWQDQDRGIRFCGYADEDGNIIVKPSFKVASQFKQNAAFVQQPDGQWFILRKA